VTARQVGIELLYALLGIAVFLVALLVATPLVLLVSPKTTLNALAGVGRYVVEVVGGK
jgi:hypothetical protein